MKVKIFLLAVFCICCAPASSVAYQDSGKAKEAPAGAVSEPETVLAEVNGEPVTLADARRESVAIEWRHLRNTIPLMEWRKQVLERVIENRAVVITAEREGITSEPGFAAVRRLLLDATLAGVYIDRFVMEAVAIGDEEVKARMPKGGTLSDFRLVRLATPEKAAAAVKRIQSGATLEELITEGVAEKVGWGQTGLVSPGSGVFLPEVEKSLFSLEEGQVSEPYTGHDGYLYMAKVMSRKTPSEEQVKRHFEAQRKTLTIKGKEKAVREFRASVFEKDEIVILYDAIQKAAAADCRDLQKECARTVVTTDRHGSYPFSELIAFDSLMTHTKRYAEEGVATPWINLAETMMFEKASARRARAEGLDKDTMVVEAFEKSDRKYLFKYLREKITGGEKVTDKEVQDRYTRDRERYQKPERRKVRQIKAESFESAEALLARIEAGERFEYLAQEQSAGSTTGNDGDLGFITLEGEQDLPEGIANLAFTLAAKEISRPYKSPEGYHILTVEQIIPARKATFEEAAPQIQAMLLQEKQIKAVDDYVDKAVAQVKITRYEEVLKKVDLN